jgi:hypothetical protein
MVTWCVHKNSERVDVTVLAEQARMFLCLQCGGMSAEHPDRCPRCGDEIPPDDDATGEGPVYWKISDEPFCSMECVIARHRAWLKEKERAEPVWGQNG